MKNFKIIVLTLLSLVAITACVDDDQEDFGSGPHIVGFRNAQGSYIYTDNDLDPVQIFEPINLLGGSNGTASTENIAINFSIDPSSTAISGTNYAINATGNTIVLPAGEDFVKLPITVYPTTLPGNIPKTIVINLTQVGTGNAVISEEKKSITITIAKCASDLEGMYSLTVTRLDTGAIYNFPNEQITELALGVYVTSTTGPYDDLTDDGAPRNGFIFKDVCQSIVIDEQNLGDFYSNLVYGNPDETNEVNLNTDTGLVESITMNYTITFAAEPRKYRAIYTKL